MQALEEAWIVEAIGEDNKLGGELVRNAVLARTDPLPESKPTWWRMGPICARLKFVRSSTSHSGAVLKMILSMAFLVLGVRGS